MTDAEAREIEGVLSLHVPGGSVTVTAEPGGARIVIEAGGTSRRFSVGDGASPLLSLLVTGRAA